MLSRNLLIQNLRLVVVTVVWFTTTHAQVANITSPPKSANISSNGEAVFTCTAVATDIFWRANNTGIGNFFKSQLSSYSATLARRIPDHPNANMRISTLTIFRSMPVDRVNITCLALSTLTNPITTDTSHPPAFLIRVNSPLKQSLDESGPGDSVNSDEIQASDPTQDTFHPSDTTIISVTIVVPVLVVVILITALGIIGIAVVYFKKRSNANKPN